jgi:hypothetical protein
MPKQSVNGRTQIATLHNPSAGKIDEELNFVKQFIMPSSSTKSIAHWTNLGI